MALANFNNAFIMLDEMGVLDSILPFLLIFTLIYAILNKTQAIGEGKKNFNILVALIISMMVVIPHIMGRFPPESDPVVIINTALPQVSIVIVAVLAVLLLIGIFGNRLDIAGTSLAGWIAMLAFGVVLYIFGNSAGWFSDLPPVLSFLNDPDTQALLIMLAVFALIIRWITASEETKVTGPLAGIMEAFKNSVKPR